MPSAHSFLIWILSAMLWSEWDWFENFCLACCFSSNRRNYHKLRIHLRPTMMLIRHHSVSYAGCLFKSGTHSFHCFLLLVMTNVDAAIDHGQLCGSSDAGIWQHLYCHVKIEFTCLDSVKYDASMCCRSLMSFSHLNQNQQNFHLKHLSRASNYSEFQCFCAAIKAHLLGFAHLFLNLI